MVDVNDMWATVAALENPHSMPEDLRRTKVSETAAELETLAGIRLGASANRHLIGIFPGIFCDQGGQLAYKDNELHQEVLGAFDYRYRLFGGAAADHVEPKRGFQSANDKCLESGLALALIETGIAWGNRMGHGFVANRGVFATVTKLRHNAKSGYDIETLDGKSARSRLDELAHQIGHKAGQVPLGAECESDFHVICDLPLRRDDQDYVRLNRKVERGDRLFALELDARRMTAAARGALDGACKAGGIQPSEAGFLWGLSCTGRISTLQET